MGNQQPKKVGRVNKLQIDMAALKAKIHLEMMRDRKNAEIIKGQKQLVAKINNPSRNRTQQILVAQRVVNGLKYSAACNKLIAYCQNLKNQAAFISENMKTPENLQPFYIMIYSVLYASERLGLSSLNQFRTVLKALNDPMAVQKYVDPQILNYLTPSPTKEEVNMYVVQMSERNSIPLEKINIIGHKFTKDHQNSHSAFAEMERQLAEKLKPQFTNSNGQIHPGGQGFGQGGQGFGQGGQGFGQGGGQGFGQQGGQGFGQGGGQGFGQGGGQGFGQGGQGEQGFYHQQQNPYKGLSTFDKGPDIYQPSQYKKQSTEQPKKFDDFDNIMKGTNLDANQKQPIYPSAGNSHYQPPNPYNPYQHDSFDSNKQEKANDPTISQFLRDLESK